MRRSVVFADQILVSLIHFVVSLVALRTMSLSEFGVFSAVFLTYLLLQSLGRAAIGEARILGRPRSSFSTNADLFDAGGLGLAGSFLCLIALLSTSSDAQTPATYWLSAGLCALVAVDVTRLNNIKFGRSAFLLVNDAITTTLVVCLLLFKTEAAVVVIAWIACATTTVIANAFSRDSSSLLYGSLRQRCAGAGDLYLDFILSSFIGRIWILSAGVLTSNYQLGLLRGVLSLFGPFTVLFAGARVALTRDISENGLASKQRLFIVMSLVVASFAPNMLLLLPDDYISLVVGPSWSRLESLVLPATLGFAGQALTLIPFVMLRSQQQQARLVIWRLVVSLLIAIAGVSGLLVSGAEGALWFSGSTTIVVGCVMYSSVIRRGR